MFYSLGQPQHSKGATEFADAAVSMLRGWSSERATFRMRFVEQPTGTDHRMLQAINRAEKAGVEIVRGVLSSEDLVAAIKDADVIIVPYRVDPFRTRTNAAVVDAMRAGKPMVVAAGTWAAQVAGSIGTSVEFRCGDSADPARAMSEAAKRLPALSERARHHAAESSERFAMSHLLAFILSTESAPSGADLAGISAAATEIESVFAAYHSGRTEARHITRSSTEQFTETLGAALQDRDQLLDELESRDRETSDRDRAISDRVRRIESSEQTSEDANRSAESLAIELEKTNLKAADLERALTKLQTEH